MTVSTGDLSLSNLKLKFYHKVIPELFIRQRGLFSFRLVIHSFSAKVWERTRAFAVLLLSPPLFV